MTVDDVGTNDGVLRTISVPIDFDRLVFRVLCAPRIVSSLRVYVAAPSSYRRDLNFIKAENNVSYVLLLVNAIRVLCLSEFVR
jgi:hypothetical protein